MLLLNYKIKIMIKQKLINTIIVVLLLIFSQNILGQQKIYLDENWKKTTQENANFYRLVDKIKDNLYQIKDYYINGNMQMDGYFSNLEKETLQGEIIWYDIKGKKTILRNYDKGKLEGTIISFLTNGNVISKGTYKNGKPYSGTIKDNCACPVSYTKYIKGKKQSDITYYQDSNIRAKEKFYFIEKNSQSSYYNEELPLKEVYYDKNNNEIGTLFYTKKDTYSISHGTEISFYEENQQISAIKSKIIFIKEYKKTEETVYHKNGEKWLYGQYKEGEKWNGGFLIDRTERNYKEGIQIGEEITYDENLDKILVQTTYKNGKPYNGSVIKYRTKQTYKEGNLLKEEEYYDYSFKNIKERTVYSGLESQTNWYNKKGDLLGIGYTNNELKNGFYIDGYKHTNYKENKKNGIEKKYNYEDEIEEITQYKNDTIVWRKTPKPNHKNEYFICNYKNNKPYEGQKMDYSTVKYYTKGFVSKKEKYDKNYDTKKFTLEEVSFHKLNDDYNNVTKRIIYKNNTPYTIEYKDGKPYNGMHWKSNYLITYKKGKGEGLFREYKQNKIIIEGNYVNDLIQGTVKYTPLKKETTTCEFVDGKPYNGIVSTYKEKITYKNGKKNGICINYKTGRAKLDIITTYKDNIKEGIEKVVFTNYKNGKAITGIYKKDKPFTGIFYNRENNTIMSYFKGEKDGEFTTINTIVLQKIVYEKGTPILEKNILKYKDSLLGEGKYKNGKAYTGLFFKKEKKYDNYVITKYKKGKKQEEIEVNIQEEISDTIKKYNYKNGKKHGKYFNRNKKELPSLTKKINGIYKKGKAYSGQFSTSKQEGLKILSNYQKGKKEGFEYYETSHGVKDSLLYKNGEIIKGIQLELLEGSFGGYYYKHNYKNGKKEKTINNHNKTEISYNTTGFTIKGDLKAEVTFTNKEKTKGIVFYYKNKKLLGFLHFENGKLQSGKVEMDFFLKRDFIKTIIQIEEKQVVTTLFPKKEVGLYYKVYSSTDIPTHLSYKNDREIVAIFSFAGKKEDMLVKQYLDDGTQLTTFHFSDKESYGILIDHKEKEEGKVTYNIRYIKKGQKKKEALKINNLNYEEMLKKVKELHKKQQI